jgi:iron complex transport system substrate-binding protein
MLRTTILLFLAIFASACSRPAQEVPPTEGRPRVVLVAPSTAANLVAMGLEDIIVGVSDYCTDPALQELPRVGGLADPNLERIAQLAPTLVLVQGNTPSLEKYCQQANIPYRAFHTDTLALWESEVQWLGEHLQRKAQAQELIASLQLVFTTLRESHSAEANQPPRVLIVASRRPGEAGGILAVGPGGFLDELLTIAGGQNVLQDAERAYVDLAEEALFTLQPEVILELESPDEDPLATWQRDFPSLPAVQNNKVLALKGEDLLMPGPGMGRVASAIAQLLSE